MFIKRKIRLAIVWAATLSVMSVVAGILVSQQARGNGHMPDASEELQKICDRYLDSMNYDLSGILSLYDGDGGELKDRSPFRYFRNGHVAYTLLASMRQYTLDSLLVQVDTLDKVLSIGLQGMADSTLRGLFFEGIRDTSLFKLSLGPEGNDMVIHLLYKNSTALKSTDIRYSKLDHSIRSVENVWWKYQSLEGPVKENSCWISHADFSARKLPDPDIIGGIRSIVTLNGKAATISPNYKDYETLIALDE